MPYYHNIELSHDDPFLNLKEFPIVDKDLLRENKYEFKSESLNPKSTHNVTTGGTSGKPFSFLLDDSAYGAEWAFIMHGWRRVGYSPGDQMITFKGNNYENTDREKYWEYNPIYNTYEFSPFHLNSNTIDHYIQKIQNINPDYIHGYPSAITKFAKLSQDNSKHLPNITAVLAASENVYQTQREIIEDTFNTRLFSHYGQSEKVALAAECEYSNDYHFYPQYGVTEILDDDGQEVSIGERGEIVATGFLNKSMPFIRYRTGDYAIKGSVGDCPCGREYRTVESLQGREEKERTIFIDESNEVPIHTIYYTMHGSTLDGVSSIQFYQENPGEITIRIEPHSDSTAVDPDEIIDDLQGKLGEDFNIEINFVESIDLTESGKKKLLIQEYE
ncbi:phenylacetate--CoA ligase family protein [Natronobacterium lacisalsi]|uniref:AMP-binding protein n=1 Tax=Natronobacterium lacisalsi TaxID=229731 RepID=UPI001EE761A9|nr:AMP-binding protein [Halobiforma lacisalsi]